MVQAPNKLGKLAVLGLTENFLIINNTVRLILPKLDIKHINFTCKKIATCCYQYVNSNQNVNNFYMFFFSLALQKCDFGLGKKYFLQLGMVPFISITYIRWKKQQYCSSQKMIFRVILSYLWPIESDWWGNHH